MKKVLVALDYDPTAQKVAEMGYRVARAMEADVILFHVIAESAYYPPIEYGPIMGFSGYGNSEIVSIQDQEEFTKKSLDYLNQTKKFLGDDNIKTAVANGNIAASIIHAAEQMHADMIVMGSHSKRWLEKVLIGSASEEVLRDTLVPLLIVPTREQ